MGNLEILDNQSLNLRDRIELSILYCVDDLNRSFIYQKINSSLVSRMEYNLRCFSDILYNKFSGIQLIFKVTIDFDKVIIDFPNLTLFLNQFSYGDTH